jgi:phosphoglycerol transferase MdoB-like AlkP superfamily enzyme
VLIAEFGTGQVFWSMVWFVLFFIWIWLLVTVFADVFRSHDLSGWGKAFWTLFVILLPYLGVFVYLIARGDNMREHSQERARAVDTAQREYIRGVVGTNGSDTAAELARLAELRDRGVISEAEFKQAKAKALA